ncbi:MAG: NAD(P)/FAD-dependent oxidoreductase [Nannocystaceae bacterium]
MSKEAEIETVVIGAGVVGCAIASRLARRGASVWVLERAKSEATGITSRNSGVIHSGLYYPPESRMARTCTRGQNLLYAWAKTAGVAHARVGKLVIARTSGALAQLDALYQNARACGARDLALFSGPQIHQQEPALAPVRAGLWCPHSGIVDAHGLTRSLRIDAERHGAEVLFQTNVTAIEPAARWFRLQTSRGPLRAARVINAAGLCADTIARMVGYHAYTIYPCRGDYFRLGGPRLQHLIYPVRDAQDPGLGVHVTLDLAGHIRMGPDAEYVTSRTDFRPAPDKLEAFRAATQRLLGPGVAFSLHYDSCGIRPKLRGPEAPGFHDFVLAQSPPGMHHLLGIESPGLTAALALAEEVEASLD